MVTSGPCRRTAPDCRRRSSPATRARAVRGSRRMASGWPSSHARRRGSGLCRQCRWQQRQESHQPQHGCAAAAAGVSGWIEGGVRLGRVRRVQRRGLQQNEERGRREEPREGAPDPTRPLDRHWDEWRENIRHHVFVADVETGRADLPYSRRLRFPRRRSRKTPQSPSRRTAVRWPSSPTGKGRDREAWTTNNDVWIVPGGGRRRPEGHGEPRRGRPTGVFAGRQDPVRPCATPGRLRVGLLVSRCLRFRASGARRTLFESPRPGRGRLRTLEGRRDTVIFVAEDEGTGQPVHPFRHPGADDSEDCAGRGRFLLPRSAAGPSRRLHEVHADRPPEIFRVGLRLAAAQKP